MPIKKKKPKSIKSARGKANRSRSIVPSHPLFKRFLEASLAETVIAILIIGVTVAGVVKVRAYVSDKAAMTESLIGEKLAQESSDGMSTIGEVGTNSTTPGGESSGSASQPQQAQATPAGGPSSAASPTPAPSPASPPPSSASNPSNKFTTLPPGSALPSDATCASKVRSSPETRPANATANATKGVSANDVYPRVTGNFAGTTDEIFQWAACKWGIDEDIVRAQAAKESWWFHRTKGDFSTDVTICAPEHRVLGAHGQPNMCPESIGILQVRWFYHQEAFENNNAIYSTAYNADYTYAIWRDCYEGNMTWLNTVERGSDYAAGDEWGCVGEWFSGRWLTPSTMTYINAVKDYKNQRVWEKDFFLAAQ